MFGPPAATTLLIFRMFLEHSLEIMERPEDLVKLEEAAVTAGVSLRTIEKVVASGVLASWRVGGRVLVSLSAVRAWREPVERVSTRPGLKDMDFSAVDQEALKAAARAGFEEVFASARASVSAQLFHAGDFQARTFALKVAKEIEKLSGCDLESALQFVTEGVIPAGIDGKVREMP